MKKRQRALALGIFVLSAAGLAWLSPMLEVPEPDLPPPGVDEAPSERRPSEEQNQSPNTIMVKNTTESELR